MKWLAGATLLGAAAARAASSSSPPFSVSVETSWPAPPLLLEILEVAHDESPASYFDLLHLLSIHLTALRNPTPETILERTLRLMDTHGLLSNPSERATFNLGLGLHTAAPRIEAAYSAYLDFAAEEARGVANCSAWVEFHGRGYCDVEDLRGAVARGIEEKGYVPDKIARTAYDRVRGEGDLQAVLYYSPTTESLPFLEYLDEFHLAHPSFTYAVRYRPLERDETRTKLAGYGVEMALKKTDYLVVDDRASAGNNGKQAVLGSSSAASNPFAEVLGDDPWAETATPLTKEEIAKLGLAATALIKASDDPMGAFVSLSQDLPKYAAAIARKVDVPSEIRKRVLRLGMQHPIGPVMFINGRVIKDSDMNAFSLLSIVRRERHFMNSLMALGLSSKQAYELISDPIIGEAATEVDPLEGIVDASDRPEGGDVIVWLNDIETDPAYERWPDSIYSYLRPVYPGQLHYVRLNTWNVVAVLDFASIRGIEAVAGSLNQLIQRNVPIHIGLVPMFDSPDGPSAQMAKVIYYVSEALGGTVTRQLCASILMANQGSKAKTVDLGFVRRVYEGMAQHAAQDGEQIASFDDILASTQYDKKLEAAKSYAERLAATPRDSASGHIFINGVHTPYHAQWTMQLQQVMTSQLRYLQEQIHAEALTPKDSISTLFYDLPSTSKRRSKIIVPTPDNELRAHSILDVFEGDATVLARQFIYPENKEKATPLSIWVVGDLDSKDGHALLASALANVDTEGSATRVSYVHIPSVESADVPEPRLSTLLYQLTIKNDESVVTADGLLDMMDEVASIRDNLVDLGKVQPEAMDASTSDWDVEPPLNAFTAGGWASPDIALAAEFWERIGPKVAERLGLKSSKPHILANGRVIGPLTADDFSTDDFAQLEQYELRKRVTPVANLLQTFFKGGDMPRDDFADMVAVASSVIAAAYIPSGAEGIWVQQQTGRSRMYEKLDEGEISFSTGKSDDAIIRVAAIVDPVSEIAQRWSGLIQWLSSVDSVATTVWLDPNVQAEEFKVKRFYRSALRTSLSFDVDGNEVMPAPTFNGLPSTPIFTMGMEVSPSWIVSPKESPLDLDNILLGNLYAPTNVLLDLKQLVVDGHAREANNQPPRGLQLQLKDAHSDAVVSDTQVMANLGYFQFKARPGVYDFSIRPGRGQEVYEIESAGSDGWDSLPVNVSGTTIRLDSFDGMTLYPRFTRRPGMEEADVLDSDSTSAGGLFSRLKSMVGLAPAAVKLASRHADINIFTVASGLLYERFASIMILSVMKHTNSSVKFWFIENFLSPTFLRFLPHLAAQYGFEYELVTYKWPSWLRAQTEKQRIIWAYKILFLDVLFPMDLDKVIFVDADQIVRTDMQELVDLDLHGHVYGYPPMGDDRKEMEGFRFWKTGYWQKELQGRPYHISALYVVDLKRFRQQAAGDRLRGTYQALSADPNSLANLDQDLPNSMQRQIPIFTLDQDWLWCQTWCSDESLATAKTIDLCQNPLTKEPKLSRARQIPEWDTYDREIAAFAATLEADGGALAANVDDLASGPGGAGAGAVGEAGAGEPPASGTETAEEPQPEAEDEREDEDEEDERIKDEL